MNFEDYLKELHAQNYMGTDDDMSDNFEYWLTTLDIYEIIELVSDYEDKKYKI